MISTSTASFAAIQQKSQKCSSLLEAVLVRASPRAIFPGLSEQYLDDRQMRNAPVAGSDFLLLQLIKRSTDAICNRQREKKQSEKPLLKPR